MNTDRLRTSVVIAVHNASGTIGECLRSIFAQAYPVHQVIVVDDGSTDNSVAVVAGLIQDAPVAINLIRRTDNGGAAAARSQGAELVTGDVVAFLDSDCVAPRDWIGNIVKEFQSDDTLGGVGGPYSHPPAGTLMAAAAKYEEEYIHRVFLEHPLEAIPPGGNSAFRTDVWNRLRSRKELVYFKGMASGEDTVVGGEIRNLAKIKFSDALRVLHGHIGTAGYFRRHVNRGYSRATIILNYLSGPSESGLAFKGHGGWPLFVGTVCLGLAVLSLPLVMFAPLVALASIAGCLILHAALSREFFRFIHHENLRASAEPRIGSVALLGLRFVLLVRSGCWACGVLLACWRYTALKARVSWNVICSIAHFWRPGRISRLFYFVTAKCNARCAFCFNLENVVNWKARQPQELTLEEVTKIAKNFKRLPYITLSGGEPFIRQDLPQVIHAFWKHAKTQWVTIPSNAALTKLTVDSTIEILSLCPGLFLTVQVSLDSMYEDHDTSRKLPGGFVKMVKTLKALSELKKHYRNLRIQIATCYDDFNIGRMDEIISYCRSNFDFDQHMFYLIRDAHTLITDGNNRLLPQYLDLLVKNERLEWDQGEQSLWARAVRTLQGLTYNDIARIKLNHEFLRPCHATQKFVTLYDDGSLSPCEVLEKVSLGNIRQFDYDYYGLMRERKIKDFHRREIVDKKCNCDWMCATPMNMLYDVSTFTKILKGSLNPGRLVDAAGLTSDALANAPSKR